MSDSVPSDGLLFVVSGPGGAGKSTVCTGLVSSQSDAVLSISATTRSPRGSEQEGTDYFFISREEFESGISAGRFAEYAEVAGNYYGTPKEFIDRKLGAGIDVFLDIDVQGGRQVRSAYGVRVVSVFIVPPSRKVLEERFRARGTDSEERLAERMALAEREIEAARAGGYDYLIINDRLADALAELTAIRRAEHNRVSRGGSRAAWVLKMWT